ncbi:MAG: cytochrome c biogenesis protein ResB [Candidatus Neomarinimicrobiota bacterium]|jgi:hypothetical protein
MNKKSFYMTGIRVFQVLTLLLLLLLIVSTFIPQQNMFPPGEYPGKSNVLTKVLFLDRFYDSPLNAGLWLLLSLSMIAAVLLKAVHSKGQRLLHFILALVFLAVAFDKFSNERFMISIREGETLPLHEQLRLPERYGPQQITLQRFEMEMHEDGQTPKAFRSHLLLNDEESVLEVNKPLSIGPYRLYQSAYENEYYFLFRFGDLEKEMRFGDTLHVWGKTLMLEDYDHQRRQFRLSLDGESVSVPLMGGTMISGSAAAIRPLGERYISVIEVAEVRGLWVLLLASLLYLVVMATDFRLFQKDGGRD